MSLHLIQEPLWVKKAAQNRESCYATLHDEKITRQCINMKNAKYKVGDVVFAKAIGYSKFYQGKIEKCYGGKKPGVVLYDVLFDDGDKGKRLKDRQIKKTMQ